MQLVHPITRFCVNLGSKITGFRPQNITVLYYGATMLATVGSIAYGAIHKAAWNSRPYQLALSCFLLSRCLMQYASRIIVDMRTFWNIGIMTLGMQPVNVSNNHLSRGIGRRFPDDINVESKGLNHADESDEETGSPTQHPKIPQTLLGVGDTNNFSGSYPSSSSSSSSSLLSTNRRPLGVGSNHHSPTESNRRNNNNNNSNLIDEEEEADSPTETGETHTIYHHHQSRFRGSGTMSVRNSNSLSSRSSDDPERRVVSRANNRNNNNNSFVVPSSIAVTGSFLPSFMDSSSSSSSFSTSTNQNADPNDTGVRIWGDEETPESHEENDDASPASQMIFYHNPSQTLTTLSSSSSSASASSTSSSPLDPSGSGVVNTWSFSEHPTQNDDADETSSESESDVSEVSEVSDDNTPQQQQQQQQVDGTDDHDLGLDNLFSDKVATEPMSN